MGNERFLNVIAVVLFTLGNRCQIRPLVEILINLHAPMAPSETEDHLFPPMCARAG